MLGLAATGDDCHRVLGLRAAASLVRRALPNGVIQVIGALDDPEHRGRTIVDTWPNLLLLWWAERQGMAGRARSPRAHLDATLAALLRADGSTFHAARLADDGTVLERGTINGYADDSTWARGQAWAIHGLASAHRATGAYREEAELAARWFLDHLRTAVPPWDFDAPAGGPNDASAAAIAAVALSRARLGRRGAAPARRARRDASTPATPTACCCTAATGSRSATASTARPCGATSSCSTPLTRIEAPERRLDPLELRTRCYAAGARGGRRAGGAFDALISVAASPDQRRQPPKPIRIARTRPIQAGQCRASLSTRNLITVKSRMPAASPR